MIESIKSLNFAMPKAIKLLICIIFWGLTPLKSQKMRVEVYLAHDCPISIAQMPYLREAEKEGGEAAEFIYFFPLATAKMEVSEQFLKAHKLKGQIRLDSALFYAHLRKARVVPEVFVFDDSNRLAYRGSISNAFYDLGKRRRKGIENHLSQAILTLKNHLSPQPSETEAWGCLIPKAP